LQSTVRYAMWSGNRTRDRHNRDIRNPMDLERARRAFNARVMSFHCVTLPRPKKNPVQPDREFEWTEQMSFATCNSCGSGAERVTMHELSIPSASMSNEFYTVHPSDLLRIVQSKEGFLLTELGHIRAGMSSPGFRQDLLSTRSPPKNSH
jgi:hypothetical protein